MIAWLVSICSFLDMTEHEADVYQLVKTQLTDDLIPDNFRGLVESPFCGHCYHSTLALYYLLGGKAKGYKVCKSIDELQIPHYWLEKESGEIIDPTSEQYTDSGRPLPYENESQRPSYRKTKATLRIIEAVKKELPQ